MRDEKTWASQWPLTGRDGELADFDERWEQPGCQRFVLVGPAGVGKTRLAEECLARAARRGLRVRRVTASAASAEVPLGALAGLVPEGTDLSDPVQCFAAVADTLDAAPDRPWVFLVDDLHLLDAASVLLLRQLLDVGAVRIIGTVRAGETASRAYAALCRGDLVHRVDLAELTLAAADALLEAALGSPVSRQTVQELHRMSGGNALYLRELVVGALGNGALVRAGDVWEMAVRPGVTPRLGELVEARLAAADSADRPVLELLALCEPLPLGSAQAVASIEALARLEDLGLVRSSLDGRRVSVSLTHPLYGEALRSRIPESRRRTLLLQQAERTEAYGSRRREDALQTANWRLAATGTADPALLVQAAALARYAGDFDQSALLALAAWRREKTVRAALCRATALVDLARHDEAEVFLREAETFLHGDDRQALFEARIDNLVIQGRLFDVQRAVDQREDEWSRMAMAGVLYFGGRLRESVQLCTPLMDSADEAIAQDARVIAVSALLRSARSREAADAFRPLRAFLPDAPGSSELRANTVYADFIEDIDAYGRTLTGDLRAAERILTAQYEEAVACGDATVVARRATGLSYVLVDRGRPQSALRVLNPVVGKTVHWDVLSAWASASAVVCAAMLGQAEALERYLAFLPEVGDDLEACNNRIARAWAAAARRDLKAAGAQLVAGGEETSALGQHLHSVWLVHAMGRLGVAGLARPFWDVPVEDAYLQARLDFTRAMYEEDADGLSAVAETFHAAGADLFAAEAFAQAALVHELRGQPRHAATATGRAAACAARCEGATPPAVRHLSADWQKWMLSEREKEIASLAGGNRSSREIAGVLHLSVRTVDNHLQKIYVKLGIRNRRDIAAAVAERYSGAVIDRRVAAS